VNERREPRIGSEQLDDGEADDEPGAGAGRATPPELVWAIMRSELLDVTPDCVKLIDREGRLLYVNRAGRRALGVADDGALGMPWLSLLPPDARPAGQAALDTAWRGDVARFPGRSISAGLGAQRWDNMLMRVVGVGGERDVVLCVSREVTAEREASDALRLSEERLAMALEVGTSGEPLCLGMVDIDHFKAYNDRYGHVAGDDVLRRVAGALQESVRRSDFVARYGGEEFTVVIFGTADAQAALDRMAAAVRDLDIAHEASQYGRLTISAGCVVAEPARTISPRELLRQGDAALYAAKSAGRNQHVIRRYEPPPG